MLARHFAPLFAVLRGAALADDTASPTVTVEHVRDQGGANFTGMPGADVVTLKQGCA